MAKETEEDKARAAKWTELSNLLEETDDQTRDRFELVTAERLIDMFAQQMRAGSIPDPRKAYEAARAITDGTKVPDPKAAILRASMQVPELIPHAREFARRIGSSMRHISYAEAAAHTAVILNPDADHKAAYEAELDQQLATLRALMSA